MRAALRRHLTTITVAFVTALVAAGGPVVAAAVYDADNAHKVDGRHAVGGATPRTDRAGKLVATKGDGRLPNDIIATAPNAQLLDNLDSSELQPRLTRTIVVSPASTVTASGARLRTAVNGIASPTAAKPWLVLVEPGVYDLGTTGLSMRAHVSIQGAGRDLTTIRCTCGGDEPLLDAVSDTTRFVVKSANNADVSHMTIRNVEAASTPTEFGIGVFLAGTRMDLDHVRVVADIDDAGLGVFAYQLPEGDWANIRDSVIRGEGIGGVGVYAMSNGRVEMTDSEVGGGSAALQSAGGAIVAIGSKVIGPVQDTAATCVHSYNEFYNPLSVDCQ